MLLLIENLFIDIVMKLEDYFEFISPNDIRIKGHRIGIDNVLELYLDGYSAEQIASYYPGLTLEKIYATLTFYYAKQSEINQYLENVEQNKEQHYQQYSSNPSPVIQRLKKLKDKQKHTSLKP